MCLAAIHWARIETLVYAADAEDAARLGFQDKAIRLALREPGTRSGIRMRRSLQDAALELFELWQSDQEKTLY
jgi:guanine deaminase